MELTAGQQLCVDTLDRPLVVAAGAGSGKTFTLTKRIVGALQSGYVTDIDQVCAITFTKKAASEIKSRLKAELRVCGFADQALRADEAWVSTIHGMCSRILKAHAIELGLDPAFTVIEDADAHALISQAVDEVLVEVQLGGSSPALDALFGEYAARSVGEFDESVESMLYKLVDAASSHAQGADAFILPTSAGNPAADVRQAIDIMEGVYDTGLAQKENGTRDKWLAATAEALAAAGDACERGIADYAQAIQAVAKFTFMGNIGSPDFREQVRQAKGQLHLLVAEMRLKAAQPHLETLVFLAGKVHQKYSDFKAEHGLLDNSDLLISAARAIEEHPSIAAQYADKFKLVMVDEFQDTDQMQVDMISRIAGKAGQRLCVVGDAQQSIYRFRGADVSVYRRHLNAVRGGGRGQVVQLSSNFRSHPDVLKFVDCVFEKPDMFGGEFMSLDAGREEAGVKRPFTAAAPRIVVQHTVSEGRDGGSEAARRVAASRIADTFAAYVRAGQAPGDMVVLLQTMGYVELYAAALRDRGLPCVISGGSVFSKTPEVEVVKKLLHVLANPRETEPLFNVLTSPLFSLAAGDLVRVGGVKRFWSAAFATAEAQGEPGGRDERGDVPAQGAQASPQLACALRVMSRARASVGIAPASQIVEQVLADSGWLSRMQAQGAEGLASAANALKAVRIIRKLEASGAVGPASLARRFEAMLKGAKEAPGALSVSGGDSVRIMTIHASKGLEFPIVAVGEMKDRKANANKLLISQVDGHLYVSLDLGRSLKRIGGLAERAKPSEMREAILGDLVDEDELVVAVKADKGVLHRRLALSAFDSLGDEEEQKRLLYVALTRAKEALVVSTWGKVTKNNPEGIPNSAMAGVFGALPLDSLAGEGVASCDFGGSQPATVERMTVSSYGAADLGEQGEGAPAHKRPLFMVPAAEPEPAIVHEALKLSHRGMFSYSSIAEVSHEGDTLQQLVAKYGVSADEPPVDNFNAYLANVDYASGDDPPHRGWVDDSDDDFWAVDAVAAIDGDHATDLGTAFHRLAQYAVVTRGADRADGVGGVGGADGALVLPPSDRIEALSRTCDLRDGQRVRLRDALERWFGSDVARDMSALPDLSAEVPFFVQVPNAGNEGAGEGRGADTRTNANVPVFLEGEIDLLGFDGARSHAYVVDYKTGGNNGERPDDLLAKHVMQAACYAYALLMQGVEQVDATFVRVERPRGADASQPQCVRYHFGASAIPTLENALATVYGRLAPA